MNMSQAITADPTPISGLTDGQSYLIQNRHDYETHIEEQTSTPDANSKAATVLTHRGGEFDHISMEKKAGEDIYIWTHYVGGASPYISIGVGT